METIGGVPVTEEMIQAWADEAERGYDVAALRKRGASRRGTVLSEWFRFASTTRC